jgi:hypothetical protein
VIGRLESAAYLAARNAIAKSHSGCKNLVMIYAVHAMKNRKHNMKKAMKPEMFPSKAALKKHEMSEGKKEAAKEVKTGEKDAVAKKKAKKK